MSRNFLSFRALLNVLAGLLNILLATAMATLFASVLWGVFTRFILGDQSTWTEPLAIYLLVWVSLLGSAVVYREKGHLGVDYFVSMLDPGAQRLVSLLVEVLIIVFALTILCHGGYILVERALAAEQQVAGLGVPMGYIYMAVPISGFFFVLFGLEHIAEWIRGTPTEARPPVISEQEL